MSKRTLTVLIAALLLAAGSPSALAKRDYVAIEKRLSAEQMQATGLDQLSSSQLELLNTLLRDDQKAIVEATRSEGGSRTHGGLFAAEPAPISSTLTGNLRGWSRGTVFTLENGQRWRVIEGDYYASKPFGAAKATVTAGKISGWYLQVEGHNPRAKVQPID